MKMTARILLLLFALPLAAQNAHSPAGEPWKSLSFLEGTWEAKATGSGGASAVGAYTFRTELANHILARHSLRTGCRGPADFDCDHGDLQYVYPDSPDQTLKAIYFDKKVTSFTIRRNWGPGPDPSERNIAVSGAGVETSWSGSKRREPNT